MPLYYLNPLISALGFALASIAIKKALTEGAGATRSIFVTNAVFFIVFLPFWLVPTAPSSTGLLWAPVFAGLVAFLGGLFQNLALKIGDVSVAMPLLGGKVLVVALLSTLILGHVLPLSWWIGALLAGLGVFFLGQVPGAGKSVHRLGLTILLAVLSLTSFSFLDITIAGWGRAYGYERFVAIQQLVCLGLSFTLFPFFKGPLTQMGPRCWPWLLAGSLLMAGQFYLLTWTISTFGDPTVMNILYSSRGIWAIVLVWSIGPLVGNLENLHGWPVFWRRILGASLLFIAILLVVFDNSQAM